MRRPVARWLTPVLVTAVAAGSAFALPAAEPVPRPAGVELVAAAKHGLRVSARVRGALYPGVRRRLRVTVSNPHRRSLAIDLLTVKVARAPRGCQRQSLRIGQFHRPVGLPARRSRTVTLSARLARDAANDCQRARFGLDVRVGARVR